jgi:hypothetical protein
MTAMNSNFMYNEGKLKSTPVAYTMTNSPRKIGPVESDRRAGSRISDTHPPESLFPAFLLGSSGGLFRRVLFVGWEGSEVAVQALFVWITRPPFGLMLVDIQLRLL